MTAYHPEALQLIFAATPDQQVTGPPGPMDPGQQQSIIRFVQPIPFQFVATFLQQIWMPREFFTMMYANIVAIPAIAMCIIGELAVHHLHSPEHWRSHLVCWSLYRDHAACRHGPV
jgi:hypothetical protein